MSYASQFDVRLKEPRLRAAQRGGNARHAAAMNAMMYMV